MTAKGRFLGFLVLVVLAAGAGTFVWFQRHERLERQAAVEQRIIDDVVALYELRILRLSDPERAAAFADTLRLSVPREELDAVLAPLGDDPRKGNRILRAVHDSLRARRSRFFPDQGSSDDGANSAATRATDASER